MKRIVLVAALALLPARAAAQTTQAPPVLSEAQEIALARSAAPSNVSGDATILILKDARYRVAVRGSNDVTCMVSRSLPLSIEPICYDPEAGRTILPMEIARVEMRLAGLPPDEIDERIDSAIASGEMAVPSRPAMAYMMSAGQILYADAETRVGRWMPHIHIYIPHATGEQFGGFTGEMKPAVGTVDDEGRPTANLVIRVREFVEPAGITSGEANMEQAQQDRRVDYIEFPSTNIEETRKFYSEVFGWAFTDYGPDYTSFSDGRMSGGFSAAPEVPAGGPLVVLYAINLEEIEARIRESGGRIVRETFDFPGGRRFHFTDPSGNELAVWSDR